MSLVSLTEMSLVLFHLTIKKYEVYVDII